MLYEIMKYIRNYFLVPGAVQTGTFTIADGHCSLPFLVTGQYFLIDGSVFNDGVHVYGAGDLQDETFTGDIAPMAVPKEFLNLCTEIETWQEKNGQDALKPFASESFAGYSYSRATGRDGNTLSWKDAFGSRLKTWRKL